MVNEEQNLYAAPEANLALADEGFDETKAWSPKGRFGRVDYLAAAMGAGLLMGMLELLLVAIVGSGMHGIGAGILSLVVGLAMIAMVAVGFVFVVRRFHDLNWSGWWVLGTFVPLLNVALAIPLLFFRGTQGSNNYGPPPKPPTRLKTALAMILPVIFFVGIVAAVAIPAYQSYVMRAQGAG